LVAALIELRKAGVDLNAMVEQQERLMGVRPLLEAESADVPHPEGHG
jgi:hypothetical protein